jgi:nucleoside-diphosphate-sugar epimerase
VRRVAVDDLTSVPGLDYTRDYLDARDVCLALLRLAASAWPGSATPVNVCSGRPRTIRELLRAVLDVMDPRRAAERADAAGCAPGRPTDLAWLVGEPRRFIELTGAHPATIELADTVRDAVVARQ